MDIINPLNASLSPNWERMTDEGVKNLNRYGIKVNAWTLNMEAAFFREIKNIGYATYTTDFCNWMEKQPYTLRPNETEIAAAPDERFALTADLILWNGQEQADVEVTALYVSPNIQKDGDRYFITEGRASSFFSMRVNGFLCSPNRSSYAHRKIPQAAAPFYRAMPCRFLFYVSRQFAVS